MTLEKQLKLNERTFLSHICFKLMFKLVLRRMVKLFINKF